MRRTIKARKTATQRATLTMPPLDFQKEDTDGSVVVVFEGVVEGVPEGELEADTPVAGVGDDEDDVDANEAAPPEDDTVELWDVDV